MSGKTEDAKIEPQVVFLCGCMRTLSFFRAGFTNLVQDDELFVLCPEHRVRRHGWRSPLMDNYQAHPIRADHTILRPNYSRNDQENEREFWNRLGIDILKTAIEQTLADKVAEDAFPPHLTHEEALAGMDGK